MLLDPVLFVSHILGQLIWAKQIEILRSIEQFPRTAVKACHSSGKTFVAAAAVLWWITTHEDAVAITTAPTWVQVEKILWAEIRGLISQAKIDYPKGTNSSLHLSPTRYAIGLATNEGVRFQGFHSRNVLIVLDEAPGVLGEIYEAIEGIRAGGEVRVLALGNPVISSGPFFDAFAEQRSGWNTITISAFDTPNLQGVSLEQLKEMSDEELDNNIRPYLTTRRWVREKDQEWGPGHPLWESRVLGNFPHQSDDALISLTWLEQAKLRTEGDGETVAGIDVAGPGEDETVLCLRQGPKIKFIRAWTGNAQGKVVAELLPYKSMLKTVNVDAVGIGFYFMEQLKAEGFPVTNINAGEASSDRERYVNRKAELYWHMRELLASGSVAGLTDDKAIGQLSGIRYSHNHRGQIVIESKEDARKRGVKSPDRAEAVILAFADIGPRYGLIEYLKQESERLNGTPKSVVSYSPCPRCGSTRVGQFGRDYRCSACGGIGPASDIYPACPKCAGRAVARIGSGWICNSCGHQFGTTPPGRSGLSRSDFF